MPRLPAADTLPPCCLRVLGVLLESHHQGQLPPTLREIADHLEISIEMVRAQLLRLRSHELVSWEMGRKRTLRLTCRFIRPA